MKVLTGILHNNAILLDGPSGLPDRTRVKMLVAWPGNRRGRAGKSKASREDLLLVRACRVRLGRITRQECR
jgi:hypothetical protein